MSSKQEENVSEREGKRSEPVVVSDERHSWATPTDPTPRTAATARDALEHAAKNLDVIALTLTDHPEYPMKAVDVNAARSLARFTAQDIRDALAADTEQRARGQGSAVCGECPHAAHTGDICDTDRPGFITGCPCRTATPATRDE